MLLSDKVALITGGAGLNGLGYATARTSTFVTRTLPLV